MNKINIQEEVAHCLLCIDAPCSKACGKGDVARALRAIRFDNAAIAKEWVKDCSEEDLQRAEQACIHYDRPVRISQVINQLQETEIPDLLPSLEIDFCGLHCENPFFLASSSICTGYDMVARAFEAGWAGVFYKTICLDDINEVSPRFDAIHREDAVISSFEHNAVLRPVQRLADAGFITYSVAEVVPGDDEQTVDNFRKAINGKTRLFVCTHASNVFGIRLPVERLCALAHSYNILFCLDAAQSAGLLDIDVSRENYDYVCCAGHKYLYGPMGTGALIINNDTVLKTLIEGGTGSESADSAMPLYCPDRLEAGTANVIGIAGLGAAVDFLSSKGIGNILKRETRLVTGLKNRLQTIEGLKVYENYDGVPVFSFSVDGFDSERVARYLSEHSDIAVRSGLHCAPLAHRQMGTLDSGTVRVAPGMFTTENDIQILFKTLRKMIHSA